MSSIQIIKNKTIAENVERQSVIALLTDSLQIMMLALETPQM